MRILNPRPAAHQQPLTASKREELEAAAALHELAQEMRAERTKANEAYSKALDQKTFEIVNERVNDRLFHESQARQEADYEQRLAQAHPEAARWQERLDNLGQLYQAALRSKGWDGDPAALVRMVDAARYGWDPQKKRIVERLMLKTAEARQAGGDLRYKEAMGRVADLLLMLAR